MSLKLSHEIPSNLLSQSFNELPQESFRHECFRFTTPHDAFLCLLPVQLLCPRVLVLVRKVRVQDLQAFLLIQGQEEEGNRKAREHFVLEFSILLLHGVSLVILHRVNAWGLAREKSQDMDIGTSWKNLQS